MPITEVPTSPPSTPPEQQPRFRRPNRYDDYEFHELLNVIEELEGSRNWTSLHGLSTVCLRYFNVFGPGQHPESKYAALFPGLISALTAGRAPEVHWDGEQTRDFTYVGDVARANLLAARADSRVDGQVINIGAGRAKSVNEVLATISRVMDLWIEPVRMPKRQGDVRSTLADITRAKDLLGWEPQADWEEAVAATVGWFTTGKR